MMAISGVVGANEAPDFEKLAWLQGCWKGTGLGGAVEECWMQPANEKMTGVFQMTRDGQLQFTEIVMIGALDDQFAMRVKHFDASFEQWTSDKATGITFPYVSMGDNYIQFDGLRYELVNEDLHVTLDMKHGDDINQVNFVYSRD